MRIRVLGFDQNYWKNETWTWWNDLERIQHKRWILEANRRLLGTSDLTWNSNQSIIQWLKNVRELDRNIEWRC